ncbi:hypothetical protein H5410_030249 [Solanum commersonii]|uniref:At2g35280-like TPR domain-containing protein n=1 Tax=Solanum commersonii TaxID=4109 RepID=A0A9J5YGA9_SOLCO|nr:hypothetical protein H5410_030249 [Solanum commersonii]
MISQAADGGHISASYVLALISIFKGGESMREGLMFIANMKKMEPLKIRRCRHKLRYVLGGMELLIDMVERIASYSFKDLMNVKLSDPNALGMINQATDGGHIGASYALAIISIFKGGESMRELIANMRKTEPLKLRRCR